MTCIPAKQCKDVKSAVDKAADSVKHNETPSVIQLFAKKITHKALEIRITFKNTKSRAP